MKFQISNLTLGHMTYERFEDLPVWQKATELYEAAEELIEKLPPSHPLRAAKQKHFLSDLESQI